MMAKDKIRPAAIKVGIQLESGQRFGFHNFRHSLATFLINKGKDVKTIQGLLRHAKASTTLDLYSQSMDESKLAAQRDIALAITSNQAQADWGIQAGQVLIQLRVFRLGGDEDGNVRIGVLPKSEKILISNLGLCGVTGKRIGTP